MNHFVLYMACGGMIFTNLKFNKKVNFILINIYFFHVITAE